MKKHFCLFAVCFLAACGTAPRLGTHKNFNILCSKPVFSITGASTACIGSEKNFYLLIHKTFFEEPKTPAEQKAYEQVFLDNAIKECQTKDGCKFEVFSCPHAQTQAVRTTHPLAAADSPYTWSDFIIFVPSQNGKSSATIFYNGAEGYAPQDIFTDFCSLTAEKLPAKAKRTPQESPLAPSTPK